MIIQWFEKHNKISWVITIFIAIIIFYLSSQTFPQGAPGPEFPLKAIIYHFFAFFFFNAFLMISIIKGKKQNKKLILITIFISILYAFSDEFHQYFVPGRSSTISDVLIDTTGILFATIIYLFRFRRK